MKSHSDAVLSVRATGELSRAECEKFVERVGEIVEHQVHPRVVVEMTRVRVPPGCGWDDPSFCLRFEKDIRRVALIGGKRDHKSMEQLAHCFINARLFPPSERERAWDWVMQESDSDKEEIRRRAYFAWEDAGRPIGRDLEFWAKAERELVGER